MIIGLSGYARSGKDTAAKGLELFGFQRVAFADKLREFIYRLNPMVDAHAGEAFAPIEQMGARRLQSVIDQYGWSGYKETAFGTEIRQLLQRLGTECGRELISDSIWIDAALNAPVQGEAPQNIVVTDVRFVNEAEAIKERGGYVVRINRPSVGPANAHPSETALDDWVFDAIIDNDESEGALHHKLHNTVLYFAL